MAHRSDPISWVRELGFSDPWDYDVFRAFLGVYLRSDRRRQAETRSALPGIEAEAAIMLELVSGTRLH